MIAFDAYARSSTELDVELGALLVAKDAYPGLDVDAQRARLDALARDLAAGAPQLAGRTVEQAAAAIAHYLYEELGFRGNEEDYQDPRNSFLNVVLDRRTGIPISLGLVLLGVARRLGVLANGVSFPGHFLVRFERPRGGPLVVDPFYGGRPLGYEELGKVLRRSLGAAAKLKVEHLKAATPRQILVRILQNVKAAYLARGESAKALVAAARIVTLSPRDASAIRDRGVLQAQLGAVEGARGDLLRYLELSPSSSDAASIRALLDKIGPSRDRRGVLN